MLPVIGLNAKYFQSTRRGAISLYYHILKCCIAILVLSKQNKSRLPRKKNTASVFILSCTHSDANVAVAWLQEGGTLVWVYLGVYIHNLNRSSLTNGRKWVPLKNNWSLWHETPVLGTVRWTAPWWCQNLPLRWNAAWIRGSELDPSSQLTFVEVYFKLSDRNRV